VFIEIDPTLSQPIFEQVTMQIKFAIAAGTVRAEEMIPSVRDLSKQLAINPNTVTRAYRQLQDEGLISLLRGIGLVVNEGAEETCRRQRKEFFQQKFQSFLDEAVRSRLSNEELREIMLSEKLPESGSTR
jgi:GntR family transcriptional regulator